MITRISDGKDEFIVCGDIGVAVIAECIECGRKFLRGVFPVRRCPICASRRSVTYTREGVKESVVPGFPEENGP